MPNAKLKFRNSLADSPSQSPIVALPGAGSLAYTGRVPAAVVTGESPIENGEHPRMLMTANVYQSDIPTVAQVRASINASANMRARFEEGLTYLDQQYADIILTVSTVAVGNPTTITTTTAHGMSTGFSVIFSETSSTPAVHSTLYTATVLNATQFTIPVNVTVGGSGGLVTWRFGQVFKESMFGYAFLYQILGAGSITGATPDHSATDYGNKAAAMLAMIGPAALAFNGVELEITPAYPEYFTPLVYDWTFDLLTTARKTAASRYFKNTELNGGWTQSGHSFQSIAQVIRFYVLTGGMAVANDGIDDAHWDSILAMWDAKCGGDLTGMHRSWTEHGNGEAAVTEGFNYFQYIHDHGLWAAEAYRTANGLSRAGFYTLETYGHNAYTPKLFVYMCLPYGTASGSYPSGLFSGLWRSEYSVTWREGLDMNNLMFQLPACSANLYRHLDADMPGYALWVQNNRSICRHDVANAGGTGTFGYTWWFLRMILGDESQTAVSPEGVLPLSYNFGTGYNVYRESMTDVSNGHFLVTFNTCEWTTAAAAGRQPTQLLGHFTVDRKGPQITLRGSHSHSGPSHGMCNRMVFPRIDRVVQGSSATDDLGDIRMSVGTSSVDASTFIQETQPDYLGTTRFHNASGSRDVDYAYADVTRGYHTSQTFDAFNPARVSRAQIDFVVFRGASAGDPVRIVRMDRWGLIASGTYEPIFLMQYGAEPIITGGSAETAGPSRQGTTHGFKQYGAATTATATNTVGTYNGKAVSTILAPSSRTVIKCGGPNENGFEWNHKDAVDAEDPASHSCEAMDHYGVRGGPINSLSQLLGPNKNYTTCLNAPDIGFYWMEVKDDSAATSGHFLLTHEVGDSTMTPSTVTNWSGTLACARIGNRAAAFRTDSAINATSGTIIASTTGTDIRVLFADFNPASTRTITYGSNITNMSIVGGAAVASGGTVVVDDVGGDFYLEFDVTSAGSGANNTITVS